MYGTLMPRKTPKRKKIQAAKLAAQPQPRSQALRRAVPHKSTLALAIMAAYPEEHSDD
jgi:hypothetical protein